MLDIFKMKAPNDPRPTWRNGVIQIHITRACDLSCTGCTQGSNLAGKPVIMPVELFEEAVKSVFGYDGVIGIFGGNPCVHPKFELICSILQKYIPFEQRGLWSNNLNGHGALCRNTFNPAFSNLNVHCSELAYEEMKRDWPECNPKGLNDSRHSPPFVALNDIEDISDDLKDRLIEQCDINQYWSAMVGVFRGELRAWFCELAGAQSMLHQEDPNYPDTGYSASPGWWKLPIEYWSSQIKKHCYECGVPLRGKGDLALGNNEYVSKTHKDIYIPKRFGRKLHLVKSIKELGGHVGVATNYIENGTMAENRVLIGVPTAEYARRADFYDYFNLLEKPAGTGITFVHGQSPARGRNMIIKQALDNNFSHILFLDDDVAFSRDLLSRLMAHDKDIVTGLYLMRNYPHAPIIFDEALDDGRCFHHFLSDNESGLVKIVAAGLGACLIKTKVFRDLLPFVEKTAHGIPIFVTLGELEHDHWCDDLSFFKKARKVTDDIWCDLDTPVGHISSMIAWPAKVDGVWLTSYDTKGEQTVSTPQYTAAYIEELRKKTKEAVNA